MTIKHLCICAMFYFLTSAFSWADEGLVKPESKPVIKDLLEQIRKDARNDFPHAAKLLSELEPEKMDAEERATWVRLSREAAVRNGERDVLVKLKRQQDPFSLLHLSRILLANAYINEANFPLAHAELSKVGDLKRINTRDQRRYWALKARLAQLESKPKEERLAITHIVHELAHWPSSNCQSCHNDPKNPNTLPLLEVQNTWYGKRFVELMQKQGDAGVVRRQAEQKLANSPEDKDARIFLGFALMAQGKQQEADQSWREIPWIALPDRSGTPPRMMFAWP